LRAFRCEQMLTENQRLILTLSARSPTARCPLCGTLSRRSLSTYLRTVQDLPCGNVPVVLHLRVRRFRCRRAGCPRRVFAEQFPDVVASRARSTVIKQQATTQIGLVLGGQAGARLAGHLRVPVSRATLLRQVYAQPLRAFPAPTIVGVDEWSWRRGGQFGTLLCDIERHQVLALLPERSISAVAAWLRQHPSIRVVCRDRSRLFAEAIAQGAPHAIQVVDRWHLLRNLRDALERSLTAHKSALKQACLVPARAVPPVLLSQLGRTDQAEAASLRRHERRVAQYHQMHQLAHQGLYLADIARQVGVCSRIVQRTLAHATPPERKQPRRPMGVLERYKPYLIERWNAGCRNARQLWRELRDQGYRHCCTDVERFVGHLRHHSGTPRSFRSVAPAPVYDDSQRARRPYMALQMARLWLTRDEERGTWEQAYLALFRQADPAIERLYHHVMQFCVLLRQRQGEALATWVVEVEQHGDSHLQSFAHSLQKDWEAVCSGLTLEWHNGQTEGHIHRLKLLKRQSYGRASVALLQQRILASP